MISDTLCFITQQGFSGIPLLDLQRLCPPSVFDESAASHAMRDEGNARKRSKFEATKAEVIEKDIRVIVVGAGLVASHIHCILVPCFLTHVPE